MELKLNCGDYVPDGAGGYTRLTGKEALVQRVLFRLTARRGAFPLLPKMGSRMYLLMTQPPPSREMLARQYAAEALEGEKVTVTDVSLSETGEGQLDIQVSLDYFGEPFSVLVAI